MKYPQDKQLVWVTFTDGTNELARFYASMTALNGKPGYEMRYPARFCPASEVVSWKPANESELD